MDSSLDIDDFPALAAQLFAAVYRPIFEPSEPVNALLDHTRSALPTAFVVAIKPRELL
jgi:hypothetical protein